MTDTMKFLQTLTGLSEVKVRVEALEEANEELTARLAVLEQKARKAHPSAGDRLTTLTSIDGGKT